jgi:hypothetical protein
MTAIQVTEMTADEARASIERIKAGLENIRAELFALRERDGWRALGYSSFQDCVQKEFQMSERHAHRLLNAYAVDRILAPPWQESSSFFGKHATRGNGPIGQQSPVAEIPESHARELERVVEDEDAVREVHAEVMEATGGEPTAADYRDAVDRRLGGIEPSARQAVVLDAIERASPILDEPETEKALYALSRARFWVYLDPDEVAEAAAEPAQDAPGYAELAAWVAAIADGIRSRADGLRIVR